jgi:hypothetical protein
MPAPVVPVVQINLIFRLKIAPADSIRLPFSGSGDLGVPFWAALSQNKLSDRPSTYHFAE